MGNRIISFIIICNNADGLANCLDSLLHQTNNKFEVIIKENTISEETYDLAVSYEKLFYEKNVFFNVISYKMKMPQSNNRSNVMGETEGEYIYYISPQVVFDKEFVDSTLTELETRNADILFFDHNPQEITSKELQERIIIGEKIFQEQIIIRRKVDLYIGRNKLHFGKYQHIYDLYIALFFGNLHVIKDDSYTLDESKMYSDDEILDIFEKYTMLIAFQEKAKSFGEKFDNELIDKAIQNLIDECFQRSNLFFQKADYNVSLKYLRMTSVFDTNMKSKERYIQLENKIREIYND